MKSVEIRKQFLDFFKSKHHHLAEAAPLVMKNDPTLMFTNAGMNQFKEIFLGNQPVKYSRVADTQPCLRVSGKHNDLEDVGHDTYHHTLFEMLGNWSFGDYFKKEAIEWAWELLTEIYNLNKELIYVTYFGGDEKDNLEADLEARDFWKAFLPENRILACSKKDNFWEMGETGPCGPCSEIHIDLRPEELRKQVPGRDLVNNDHPQVIEIWNLVFMQFNRNHNGVLEPLPNAHVDTGMGFERLTMALQGKTSNYDTDIFQPLIAAIEQMSSKSYGQTHLVDVAMRVIADHIRAIAFIIADGQLPSNNKAGYVCRRILRRAVRYGYTYLGFEQPFLYALITVLANQMGDFFPQLRKQEDLLKRIVKEEEISFLRTLSVGLRKLEQVSSELKTSKKDTIAGETAFELYDTFGFPFDLTALIAKENNLKVDENGFQIAMQEQKNRSRIDAATDTFDWIVCKTDQTVDFCGYDFLEIETEIIKYRKVIKKGKDFYQLVLNPTPFYAESGGQVGDTGWLITENEQIEVLDTQKENSLIMHTVQKLPKDIHANWLAKVDVNRRKAIMANHSATHLLHAGLRQLLGNHVEQKGSLVGPDYLRFDFSHFSKLSETEIKQLENYVNDRIFRGINKLEIRDMPINDAKKEGAMALFGEKYGDKVRVICFDKTESIELCGGTHVENTSHIGVFKILTEGSVSSGVRRIEALTQNAALTHFQGAENTLEQIRGLLNNAKNLVTATEKLISTNAYLQKQLNEIETVQLQQIATNLYAKAQNKTFLSEVIDVNHPDALKKLCFELRKNLKYTAILLISEIDGKAHIALTYTDDLVKEGANASSEIKSLSKFIEGGGGGQPHLATAGGNNINEFEGLKKYFANKYSKNDN